MRFEFARRIGVFVQVAPVGIAVTKQAVHHGAGKRRIGARLHQHREIGLLHGAVHIDIDRRDLGAALFARAHGVGHDVDLGVHGVGAPDHHKIGLCHFAWIDTCDTARASGKSRIGRVDANSGVEAGIFLHVAQPVNAVAHHQPHRAGIIIGPHRFRAVALLGFQETLGNDIERVVPGDGRELAGAFRPGPAQRLQQALRMMFAFGVTRDLRADHTGSIVVIL